MPLTISDYPELMQIWDREKNEYPPEHYPKKSADKVWWKCPECGYNWQTSVRGKKNGKCPACTGSANIVIPGKTDFASAYPELGLDFVQELNPGVDATLLGAGSQERLTWKCHTCGHIWQAPIYGRIRRDKKPYRVAKCPTCAGQVRTMSFSEEFPELVQRYSPNNALPLSAIPADWQAKYLWVCDEHGEFEAVLSSMIRALRNGNSGCPYCHGTKVKSDDSFGALHPDLVKEWSPENELSPYDVSEHSKQTVKWVCDTGHTWEATPDTRANGYGKCRECNPAGKRVMDYFLDAYEKYRDDKPIEKILFTDTTEYEWECENGHRYKDTPYNINQRGKMLCPVCSFREIRPGVNDFETLYPEYAKALIGNKQVSPVSSEDRDWICDKGHRFRRSARAHIGWKGVCPVCSKHVLQTGENDLLSAFPEVKDIWDYEKNGVAPDKCMTNTSKVRWWVCDAGHSYRCSVNAHIAHDWRCPVCHNFAQEKENPLTETDPELVKEWSSSNERGPETYEKSAVAAVKWICPDCGGEYTARVIDRELGDDLCPYCADKRVLAGLNDLATTDPEIAAEWADERPVESVSKSTSYFARWRCPECGSTYGRNIRQKATEDCPYCYGDRALSGVNDLATTHPDLAKEWSPSNERSVSTVTKNLRKRFKWICPTCNGEYSARIRSREIDDDSCPYCNERRVFVGFNDLATVDPELAKEWSPSNDLPPTKVGSNYSYRALWICPQCEGEYSAQVRDRRVGDDSCPYCANRRIQPGFNDLATTKPELANEWSPSNEKAPSEIGDWYAQYVKWVCPDCGNEYGYQIRKRDVGDDSCPYCAGLKAAKGFNDLVTTHPAIAAEWADTNERTPDTVTKSYTDSMDWKCPDCGGIYKARVIDRDLGDCPYCEGRRILPGLNDLATVNPELAAEWSSRNTVPSSKIRPGITLKAFWVCPDCGGEYVARICDREVGDNSCPYCADKRVLAGHNDLATTDPELAKEWAPSNDRTPDTVMKTMKFSAQWICPTCGGEYSARIYDREVGDDSCPYCADKRVLPGYNSFMVNHPDLMKEWVWVNNYVLCDPDTVSDSCTKVVWWQCKNDKNHRYKMSPATRLMFQMRNMEPCTICKGRRRDKSRYVIGAKKKLKQQKEELGR